MAKATKKAGAKKASRKRELIAPRGDKRYIRRDEKGRIVESDDVSRSLSMDRKRTAKATAKPGYGDQGDRKPKATTTKAGATKNAAGKSSAKKAAPKKTAAKKATGVKKSAK